MSHLLARIETEIAAALPADVPLSQADRRLLRVIATGLVSENVPVPRLPSYALRKALAPVAAGVAERLFGLVETAPAAEAIALLSAALAFNADHIPARLALAWRLFDTGERVAPCQIAADAYARAPEQAAAAYGWFLIASGDLNAAEAILKPALAAYPAQAPLHWYSGILFQRSGDLAEAVAALRTAHGLDPSLPDVPFALAWILHDLGDIAEAQAWSAEALALRPDADRLLQAGWLALCLRQYEAAQQHYRAAAALVPVGDPRRAALDAHWLEADRMVRACGGHFLVLSPDAALEPAALIAASARLNSDPSIGVVIGRIMGQEGVPGEATEDRFASDSEDRAGTFLLVRRVLWDMLGGLEATFESPHAATVAFCLRVLQAGFRVVDEPVLGEARAG